MGQFAKLQDGRTGLITAQTDDGQYEVQDSDGNKSLVPFTPLQPQAICSMLVLLISRLT